MVGNALLALIVVGALAVAGTFYIDYRNVESSQVAHITSVVQINGVAPSNCSYDIGAFGQGSAGNMYIYNNKLRVSVPDLDIAGYEGNMQAVIGQNGIVELSASSVSQGLTEQDVINALNTTITKAPWHCAPWWFPNSTLFTISDAL
jgi:hypothetical protein